MLKSFWTPTSCECRIKPHSDLAKIFELVREDKVKLVLSESILSEIRAVLLYPKIKKTPQAEPERR